MDPNHNVGVVITYQPGATNTLRVNTRSLHSLFDQISQLSPASPESATNNPLTPGPDWDITSLFKTSVSENDAARALSEEIERTCMRGAPDKNGAADTGGSGRVHKHTMVEEREIISTASAKKRTGYLEHLVFDIKKLVWA
ncbi:predicted protein [Histoplasma mississippiense (nom. inval.)]|uniref:predicted protein n=1 Tax=Ajellomyces capsulatus (strain NAm1 / WU24) TaxID=2059318 RepID=UPI000157BC04|nr:predicted protein [Histoplasma mississippiense (nom. inval.)]EDN05629.1 predicted protein [Histoplasma mississippiense (nom. inval.)]